MSQSVDELTHLAPDALLRLAKRASKREQWSEALQLWRQVAKQGAANVSFRKLVNAQLDCAAKLGLGVYHPEVPPPFDVTSSTDPSTACRRPRMRNSDPRHIVVAGMPFCGSTLLGLVLGGLPGVANVGESHWLIDKRAQRTSQVPPLTSDGYEQCMTCGAACPVVTAHLRQQLADPTTDFYGTLGQAYGSSTVLTSDKYYEHILRFDPALYNDAIVLFRHPVANWQSHCDRNPAGASAEGQRKYFKRWADVHTAFLRYFDNRGTKVFLDFAEFSANPEPTLKWLCRVLALPFDATALSYWQTPQHYIGGNMQLAHRRHGRDMNELRIRPLPAQPTADAASEARDEQARAICAWEDLQQHEAARRE